MLSRSPKVTWTNTNLVLTVSDEITPFYGYYTIDLEKDGQIVGMLSVNGYDRTGLFSHLARNVH